MNEFNRIYCNLLNILILSSYYVLTILIYFAFIFDVYLFIVNEQLAQRGPRPMTARPQ